MNISIVSMIIKDQLTIQKKENSSVTWKKACPSDERKERTKEIIRLFDFINGEEINKMFLKSDVLALADIFEKSVKISIEKFFINTLYCLSLSGYNWECGFISTLTSIFEWEFPVKFPVKSCQLF